MTFARELPVVEGQNLSLVKRICIKEMKTISEDKFKKLVIIGRREKKSSLSGTQGQRMALLIKKYKRT